MYQHSPTVHDDAVGELPPDFSLAVLDALPEAVIVCTRDGTVLTSNHATEDLLGYCAAELSGSDVRLRIPGLATVWPVAGCETTQLSFRRADGLQRELTISGAIAHLAQREFEVLTLRDAGLGELRRGELLVHGERKVFEHIGRNSPLHVVLDAIARWMAGVLGDCACSVNVLNESGDAVAQCLGPDIPAALRVALLDCHVQAGDFAPAAHAHLERLRATADLSGDATWHLARAASLENGFQSAWSRPIVAASGRVLGLLAVFHRRRRELESQDRELLLHAARLAALAIERGVAEHALRASEAKFRGLYEHMMEGVFECDPDGELLSMNPALVAMLGYDTADELLAHCDHALPFASSEDGASLLRRLVAFGEVRDAEQELRGRDQQLLVVLINARTQVDYAGLPLTIEGTIADITERKRAERQVFDEKERAQVTLQSIGEAVIRTDASGNIDYMNPIAEALTGWTLFEGRGRPLAGVLKLIDENSRLEVASPLLRCLREGTGASHAEHGLLQSRGGQDVAIHSSVAAIRNRMGETIGAVTVFRDVTKERRLKRALSYQAAHDALTGLINRREFDARLQEAVETARRGEGAHVLLYVDLDQFKVVNDTCGHPAGDRLLRDVTALLQARVRAADTIARLGGDEFGILLEGCTVDQGQKIAEVIRGAIRDYRFVWNDESMSIGASIGMVCIGTDTESVASLMSAADIACYAAKDSGRNRVHLYDRSEVSGRHREMYWVARLTRAVEEDRLELHAQPIRAVREATDGKPARFHELLVRLRDERGVLVAPGEFIPAAERYNVMSTIDRWVVQQAVELLRALPPEAIGGESGQLYAVNLSGTSLNDPGFIEFALAALPDRRVAGGLCFEITETAAVANLRQAVYFMHELRARGCRFALDDFGSGLSSFRYLKTLPVDYLKIDGQFVGNVASDPVDRSMVEAICHVGRTLGIHTIAERVESAEVLASLRQLGVDYVQGYLLGRPEPLV